MKLDDAFKRGQEAAQSMVADLDGFMASRFGHIKGAYLEILAKGIREDLSQTDHSPILAARAQIAVFNENVTDLQAKMLSEIREYMREWEEFDQLVGVDQVASVVKARLGDLEPDLRTSGLDLLIKHADALKIADDSWRRANPRLAEQEPLEPYW
ncbi:hypothetical protein [Mesorhizobium escarrei]|uniref:hypothetical protein n=1 Tax=Mesorhizobium escarrei TaxID=666018 RepID=UPI0020A6DE98|nr:hypothetical protein [Mesorhizobium escarrei]